MNYSLGRGGWLSLNVLIFLHAKMALSVARLQMPSSVYTYNILRVRVVVD